jgi:hypothetical protein
MTFWYKMRRNTSFAGNKTRGAVKQRTARSPFAIFGALILRNYENE